MDLPLQVALVIRGLLSVNSRIRNTKIGQKCQVSGHKRNFYQNDGTYLPQITRETCVNITNVRACFFQWILISNMKNIFIPQKFKIYFNIFVLNNKKVVVCNYRFNEISHLSTSGSFTKAGLETWSIIFKLFCSPTLCFSEMVSRNPWSGSMS